MEPFEENVGKYENQYENNNLIYKKIQIAKKEMSKASKSKKIDKSKMSISNVESSAS